MDIEEELSYLGTTPDDIARSLTALGIKGEPHSSCNCPISNYLEAVGFKCASVGEDMIILNDHNYILEDNNPIRSFIISFDLMKYPELVS
jgi:hypothetical protein